LALSPARTAAFDILHRVEQGGYASDLLRAAPLDSRDAGLAGEIVFGVLRRRAQLDYLIERYSGRRAKLDVEVRQALRMGIYQLRYLDRVPAHAAVGESVGLVKRARKHSAAGFVNAVLRKVNRDAVEWPNREIELSCPEWLLARWERHYGAAARRRHRARGAGRSLDVRAGGNRPHAGHRVAGHRSAARSAPGTAFSGPVRGAGEQDGASAGGGGAGDRLRRSPRRLAAMKTLGVPLVVVDGTRPLPFARRFDRVLVDAPCSGTGTLGRNPEIKWRLTPEDLEDLSFRQAALLANARAVLAPGGRLVYATCSLEPEENEAVVAAVAPELVVERFERLPGRDAGDGFRGL